MNRHKLKTSVLVCYLIALFFAVAGCEGIDSLNRAGPGQPYSWLTDEEKRAALREGSGYDPSWDIMNMQLQVETEKLKRENERRALENSLYIGRMRRMLKQQELQREFNERSRGLNR